jgi:hypothetical protein
MFCSVGAAPLHAQQADILLAGHPERLVAYSVYQQRLTPDEVLSVPSYAPMVISREHDVLGDGFTPCMQVEVAGRTLYLQLSTSGQLIHIGGDPSANTIRSARLLGDTILVKSPSGISLSSPDQQRTSRVPSGTLLCGGCLLPTPPCMCS